MGGRGVGTGVCVALCVLAAAAPAGAATHSNSTPILDPNYNTVGPQQLDPYPSTISVSGEQGSIVKARVTIRNLQGGQEPDLDVLLVGPGGSTILFSDVCATGLIPDFIGEAFTFDDDASASLPGSCSSRPASGTYKPSNNDTADNFPGIPPPYPLGLANVRGTSPNGNWNLYAVDDSYPDPVTINGGWTLELTTTGTPASGAPATTKKRCKKRKHRSASAAKKKCKKKRR